MALLSSCSFLQQNAIGCALSSEARRQRPVHSSVTAIQVGGWSSIGSPMPCRTVSAPSCRRLSKTVRADVSVQLGGGGDVHDKAAAGDRLKVVKSVKVYHVPKVPSLELEGMEGVVKEVLGEWKGTPVSANLPYKVQFETKVEGNTVKFLAHLRDDEFEVV